MTQQKRDPFYDVVKGLGIICVVYGHSQIGLGHYIIYMFHMPLFFFVSGCLHKQRTLCESLVKKTRSLLKPYLALFFICAFVDLGIEMLKISTCGDWGNFDLLGIVKMFNIFNPKENTSTGPLWFMICLFEVSLLFQLLLNLKQKYLPILISIVLSIVGYLLSQKGIRLVLYIDSALSVTLFYCLGYYFKPFASNLVGRFRSFGTMVCLVALYLLYLIDFKMLHLSVNELYRNQIMENYCCFIISASIGILCVFFLANIFTTVRALQPLQLVLQELGKLSLFIFALHIPIMNICRCVLPPENTGILIVYVIVSILASYFAGRLLLKYYPKLFS